jgi:hypothetical protein
MQYTIRDIPKEVDKALRAKAKAEGTSLNEVALRTLAKGLGLDGAPRVYDDLDWFLGSGGLEPAVTRAMEQHDVVHPDDWK